MRRRDKLKNIQRVNRLLEARNLKESFHDVDGTPIGVDSMHRPIVKEAIPLKHVGGKEGDADPKERIPLKPKVIPENEFGNGGEFDNAEEQGQEDFYDQMNKEKDAK
jgi:hypothetical protein